MLPAAPGRLHGYDKHMNLLLRDVDEQYTVRLRVERARVGWVRKPPGGPPGGPPRGGGEREEQGPSPAAEDQQGAAP